MKGICDNTIENECWKKNQLLIGMDEAGRGPLAGPLVVAGVIFPIGYTNPSIYDSKALSEKKRNELFKIIYNDALSVDVRIVSSKTIDQFDIYHATQRAMISIRQSHLDVFALSDAMPLPGCDHYIHMVKGDQHSISVAGASIVAKVIRDHMMMGFDMLYPQYGFAKHKGYGTKAHIEAMAQYGLTPIHRLSFSPCRALVQPTLF